MQSLQKPASNLARLGKVDVRKDEDQNVKLSQIIKLLIDAGYFRARVKGLSPFDKIIGGMTWCIEVCNFDIDVDLLFHDNLTIGQKIALTERIVKVLPFMKCPYSIEPHQIQGLDAIHIFPVIEWLVNQALETREEYQDETRRIALNEFDRHYRQCLLQSSREDDVRDSKYIADIKLRYGPKRRFRRAEDLQIVDEKAGPLMTLLEYSESQEKPQLYKDSDTESIDEEDEEFREKISEKMSAEVNISTRSSANAVSIIVEDQVKDLAKATETYLRLKENETIAGSRDLLVTLEKKAKEVTKSKESKLKALIEVSDREKASSLKLETLEKKLLSLHQEFKSCENFASSQSEETLEKLSQLLEANEAAKKAASAFKEKCRQEADEIKKSISEVKEELEKEDPSEMERLQDAHAFEMKRLKKVKEAVASQTREIESLKRLIDDVPGRAELSQYQKRFIELYNLVEAEQHQTLQFYNMYNCLADSRFYMDKESDLLNSILDNMEEGLTTSSSLDQYITQLKDIIDGIVQNKLKLEKKRNKARSERTTLAAELSRLQDLQLHYARILHLFSQEISNNDLLLEQVGR